MELDFINSYPVDLKNYRGIYQRLAQKTFSYLRLHEHYYIEVNLVDDQEIHELNKQFRQIDRPTDVLSFAFLDKVAGETPINDEEITVALGTIIISVDRAKNQAKQYGHSFQREMKFLFLHGLLHLLGYDHQKPKDEVIMFSLQNAILGKRKVD